MKRKPKTAPRFADERSGSALAAMCEALIRRLPGLEGVSKVEVVRIDTAEGPNWDLAHVEIEPPLSAADRERVEAVIEPWRRRFNMLGDGREALHKAHSEARV